MRRMGAAEREWLRGSYAEGTIHDTLDAFEAEFGWRPTKNTVYTAANKMGLRKDLHRQDPRIRDDRAQVRIRWSCEPEMEAWMLEHDVGDMQATVEGFEAAFGIRLSRGQVNLFRAGHGTQQRKRAGQHRGGRDRKPLGFERETKGGILVKVAPEATVPMSKDNWRLKHHIAYEAAYGPIPEGCQVMAVDGDVRNCDPANLVAVPKRAIGALNQARGEGRLVWHDRDTMLACVAIASLTVAARDAEHRAERRCAVCGEPFGQADGSRRAKSPSRTCPACLAAGRKAPGKRHARSGPAVKRCAVCGCEFAPGIPQQVRCDGCIAAQPKLSPAAHRRLLEAAERL